MRSQAKVATCDLRLKKVTRGHKFNSACDLTCDLQKALLYLLFFFFKSQVTSKRGGRADGGLCGEYAHFCRETAVEVASTAGIEKAVTCDSRSFV